MNFIKNNSYLLFAFMICFFFVLFGTMKSEDDIAYESVTITEGDTLWGLAVEYAGNESTEKWIEQVVQLNGLTSTTIQMGEDLRLPLTKYRDLDKMGTQIAGDND